MERTWEQNAEEFRDLDKGEGWPFAHLVACSVEKGKAPKRTASLRNTATKVSANEFASAAGCGFERVLNYLKAWDRECAKAGQPLSKDLTPEDTWTLDLSGFPEWKKGTLGTKSKADDIKGNPSKVAEAFKDPDFARKVMADPDAASVIGAAAARNADAASAYRAEREKVTETGIDRIQDSFRSAWDELQRETTMATAHNTAVEHLIPKVSWDQHKTEVLDEWAAAEASRLLGIRNRNAGRNLKAVQ